MTDHIDPVDRTRMAEETGFSEDQLEDWADLFFEEDEPPEGTGAGWCAPSP